MENDRYNLEKISQDYKILLFDANAILNPFGRDFSPNKWNTSLRNKKTEIVHRQVNYLLFLQDCLKKGYQFYLTEDVIREINKKADPQGYRRHIRHWKDRRKKAVPYKSIERKEIEIDRLVSLLLNQNRVVKLNESEEVPYFTFHTAFSDLASLMKLSGPDFDFLISGMALTAKRGQTALITNDKGIRATWMHLKDKGVFNSLKLGLYVGNWSEKFVRLEDYLTEIEAAGKSSSATHK